MKRKSSGRKLKPVKAPYPADAMGAPAIIKRSEIGSDTFARFSSGIRVPMYPNIFSEPGPLSTWVEIQIDLESLDAVRDVLATERITIEFEDGATSSFDVVSVSLRGATGPQAEPMLFACRFVISSDVIET